MYSIDEVNQFIDLVAETVKPDRIILFGSYAYGDPTEKSDIDLLVIINGKDLSLDDEAKLSAEVYQKRKQYNIRTRYDVFFQTDKQAQELARNGGAFHDALQRGIVVYEHSNQQKSRAVL